MDKAHVMVKLSEESMFDWLTVVTLLLPLTSFIFTRSNNSQRTDFIPALEMCLANQRGHLMHGVAPHV